MSLPLRIEQADHMEAVDALTEWPAEPRRPASALGLRTPGLRGVGMPPEGKSSGSMRIELDRVAHPQHLIGVAPERPIMAKLALRHLDVGAHMSSAGRPGPGDAVSVRPTDGADASRAGNREILPGARHLGICCRRRRVGRSHEGRQQSARGQCGSKVDWPAVPCCTGRQEQTNSSSPATGNASANRMQHRVTIARATAWACEPNVTSHLDVYGRQRDAAAEGGDDGAPGRLTAAECPPPAQYWKGRRCRIFRTFCERSIPTSSVPGCLRPPAGY